MTQFVSLYGAKTQLLLDTRIFLWWCQQHPALNASARAAIRDVLNNVVVSAASVLEIAVKRRLGTLLFEGAVCVAIDANGFHELPVAAADAELAGDLAWQHGDPFGRLLAAQAIARGFTLVTADRAIRAFEGVAQLEAG